MFVRQPHCEPNWNHFKRSKLSGKHPKNEDFGQIVNCFDNLSVEVCIYAMIARKMEQKLTSLAKAYPLVTLTGPRQSGKTTLCHSAFHDYQYLSFEDPDVRESATSDARRFLSTYSSHCILDEVQRVPALYSYLQGHVDRTDETGQFILIGSQNFLLAENVTQSLAGRTALLSLLPFSITELESAGLLSADLDNVIFSGGYPRLFDHSIAPPISTLITSPRISSGMYGCTACLPSPSGRAI